MTAMEQLVMGARQCTTLHRRQVSSGRNCRPTTMVTLIPVLGVFSLLSSSHSGSRVCPVFGNQDVLITVLVHLFLK